MPDEQSIRRHFASDNYSGICPEAWAAMAEANADHEISYGNDTWTQRAADLIREIFETDCEVFFVFNGTAANSLSLSSLCQSYHSFLCHEIAHIETSECGAPEFFANGSKILLLRGENGKIDPRDIDRAVNKRKDIHYPKPRALSITQATEVGTVYTVDEIGALTAEAQRCGLRVHMDGARFANAVASLNVSPAEATWKSGVDVLCFGGTKNGLAVGEAVVFFDRELAKEFDYRCKQGGQLASKMRFLSAPWTGMLKDGAWLKHARHANEMAKRLEAAKGAGSVFSFDIKGTREQGKKFVDTLKLFSHLANVGDVRSLVIHPASTTHFRMSDEALAGAGIGPGTIRLSIGLEDPQDLIDDLKRALKAAEKAGA